MPKKKKSDLLPKWPLRTRFCDEIVTEFLPPVRKSNKVLIYCDGMPGLPGNSLMHFFAELGYWIFSPRYRGTWESGGKFLKESPEEDILDVLDELHKGFISIGDGENFHVNPTKVVIVGSSFGGPAAILASRYKEVTKAIAVSPVVDWRVDSPEEPMDWLYSFVKDGFGEGYRFTKKDWDRLSKGKFYNPIDHINELSGKKLMLIHAQDDEIVPAEPTIALAKEINAKLVLKRTGGHLSSSLLKKQPLRSKMLDFLSA